MWLEEGKFQALGSAVLKGERRSLTRIFSEIFHPENHASRALTQCPTCQKTLVKKMHPYLEYFLQSCPDRHGAWLSPEVSRKIRDLAYEQLHTSESKKRLLFWTAAAVAAALLLAALDSVSRSVFSPQVKERAQAEASDILP